MRREGGGLGLCLFVATISTGCASTLSTRASAVRWVDTRQEVGSCKYLGVVDGSSAQTGVANISTGRNNARNEALEHAAEKGATHIHWLSDDESFSGIHMSGEAYDCAEQEARVAKRDVENTDSADEEVTRPRAVPASSKSESHEPSDSEPPPQAKPQSTESVGLGSCFFVSADGIAVTNRHVVDGARRIVVIDSSSVKHPATVLRTSATSDLVALDVPTATHQAAVGIETSTTATLGEPIFTIGFPYATALGFDPKFADGSISGLRGLENDRLFQITVPIQPGNSGGPVVNDRGGVIGIVVSHMNDLAMLKETGSLPQNLSFAIKSDELGQLLRGLSLPKLAPTKNRTAAISRVQAAACEVIAFSSDEEPTHEAAAPVPVANVSDAALTKAQISSTVASLRSKITACKDGDEGSALNEVVVKADVAADGSVRSVTVNGSATSDDEVEDCVLKVFRRAQFPPSAGGKFSQTVKL